MGGQKYLFSRSELEALVLTALGAYMETLHFDDDVAKQTAELIAQLDEDCGKGEEWRRIFATCNRELAEMVVHAILIGKKYIDREEIEIDG